MCDTCQCLYLYCVNQGVASVICIDCEGRTTAESNQYMNDMVEVEVFRES